jgi:hypothetical protein
VSRQAELKPCSKQFSRLPDPAFAAHDKGGESKVSTAKRADARLAIYSFALRFAISLT